MVFDVEADPHEQNDLATSRPDLVKEAMSRLDAWQGHMMETATNPSDPMRTVIAEGGPLHTRGFLPAYLRRLQETERGPWADTLAALHPREANPK
jgi:hypothetical protein